MNNFRSRREVEQVRRLVLAGQVVKPGQTGGIPALICKTASGGIPARSVNVAGIADDVMVQTINADGTMEDSDREITVYNPFGTAVAGSVYITCKFVNNGYWIVDAEDCG